MQTTASLFAAVMSCLWDDHGPDSNHDRVTRALASHVKTHKLNPENAFDVLNLFWPSASCQPRFAVGNVNEPEEQAYFAKFDDGSQAIIISGRGIGNSVEPF